MDVARLVLTAALLVMAALVWPLPGPATVAWSHPARRRRGRDDGAPAPAADVRPVPAGPGLHARSSRSRVAGGGPHARSTALADGQAADLADLVALGLEAGLPLDGALALAGADRTRLPPLLAQTLTLSAGLGAPVGPSARSAAVSLRERARAKEATRALSAGPRASMHLLTLLPLLGPIGVALLGLPLSAVYGTPLSAASATLGLVLTGLGWVTARAIVRRAERPTLIRRPAMPGPRRWGLATTGSDP